MNVSTAITANRDRNPSSGPIRLLARASRVTVNSYRADCGGNLPILREGRKRTEGETNRAVSAWPLHRQHGRTSGCGLRHCSAAIARLA